MKIGDLIKLLGDFAIGLHYIIVRGYKDESEKNDGFNYLRRL